MINYEKEIITRLLDIYERRGAYRKAPNEVRPINITVAGVFPNYADIYNHSGYKDINLAIERLMRRELISAVASSRGIYEKLKFKVENVEKAYLFVERKPLANKYEELLKVVAAYEDSGYQLLDSLLCDFKNRIQTDKKLPFGIEYDAKRLDSVLYVIRAILQLSHETYVRNFSIALFKDSKVFQKEYRGTIQSILYEYTETTVEKDRILEVYNLYENPTYVLLKGNAVVIAGDSKIYLSGLTGGISIPERALEDITEIQVKGSTVVTVENLTAFHDCSDSESLYIYLGGFHNHSKEMLLKKVYEMNPDCQYFHKGDLDVYGFAILESLKLRTGIPFEPLEMDLETLKKLYEAGLYKKLSDGDKKAMAASSLQQYADVFQFMLEHDCKAEQESMMALNLM